MPARNPPEIVDLELDELEALLRRLEGQELTAEDFQTLGAVCQSYLYVTQLIDQKSTTIARLRKLLFGTQTESTSAVTGRGQEPDAAASGSQGEATDQAVPAEPSSPKPKAKGHGRNGADDYPAATRVRVTHPSLEPGDACPRCERGTVYAQAQPGTLLRFTGAAPIQATVYELQKLRCQLCGQIFTASAPDAASDDKYDATVASMIGLLKYGSGFPFNRLDGLQASLGIPLAASTQWDIVAAAYPQLKPVHDELVRQAAQGEVLHNDDTTVKILELMGERAKAAALAELKDDGPKDKASNAGAASDPNRKGLFTSGVVATREGCRIALFFSGRRHAGENLRDVLRRSGGDLSQSLTASYSIGYTLQAENGNDVPVAGASGSVTFTAGQTTTEVPVAPPPSTDIDGYPPQGGTATITIAGEDDVYSAGAPGTIPVLAGDNVEGSYPYVLVGYAGDGVLGGQPGELVIERSATHIAQPLSINYTLVSGYYTAGVGYAPPGLAYGGAYGTLTFPAGQSQIDIPIADDDASDDPDAPIENIDINLLGPQVPSMPNYYVAQGESPSGGGSYSLGQAGVTLSPPPPESEASLSFGESDLYVPIDQSFGNGQTAQRTVTTDGVSYQALVPVPDNELDRDLQHAAPTTFGDETEVTLTIADLDGSPPEEGTVYISAPGQVIAWSTTGERALSIYRNYWSGDSIQLELQGIAPGDGDLTATFVPDSGGAVETANLALHVFGVDLSFSVGTNVVDGVNTADENVDDDYYLGYTDADGNPIADDDPSETQYPTGNDPDLITADVQPVGSIPAGATLTIDLPAGLRVWDEATQALLDDGSGAVVTLPANDPLLLIQAIVAGASLGIGADVEIAQAGGAPPADAKAPPAAVAANEEYAPTVILLKRATEVANQVVGAPVGTTIQSAGVQEDIQAALDIAVTAAVKAAATAAKKEYPNLDVNAYTLDQINAGAADAAGQSGIAVLVNSKLGIIIAPWFIVYDNIPFNTTLQITPPGSTKTIPVKLGNHTPDFDELLHINGTGTIQGDIEKELKTKGVKVMPGIWPGFYPALNTTKNVIDTKIQEKLSLVKQNVEQLADVEKYINDILFNKVLYRGIAQAIADGNYHTTDETTTSDAKTKEMVIAYRWRAPSTP